MTPAGMVDALHAAHRRVRRGGVVIDARPDASRHPRIVARGRVRAYLRQSPDADERDRRADAAVDRVVALGLYRRVEAGRVWHASRFADLAELDAYVEDSPRYSGYYVPAKPGGAGRSAIAARWTTTYERRTRRALIPFRRGPLAMRRAVKFEVLERR